MEFEIASQLITKGIDIILGGGSNEFIPIGIINQFNKLSEQGGRRRDRRNLIEEASEKYNYHYISNLREFRSASELPIFGLFSSLKNLFHKKESHMDYECDRDISKQPSLSEMTKKAINLLQAAVDSDPKSTGFYLLVEGSRFGFSINPLELIMLIMLMIL
jgi:alkaline phosphatase